MPSLLNSLLFILGVQTGIGFELGIFIISGNFGYADTLLPICLIILLKRKVSNNVYPFLIIFLALIFIMIFSNFVASSIANLSGSILPVFRIIWLFLFFFLILISQKNNVNSLICGLSVGVTSYAVYTFYLYSLEPRTFFGVPYIASEINNGNTLGFFMTFGVIANLILLDLKKRNYILRRAIWFSIILCSITGLLTISKTAWLSLFIIFSVYIFFRLKLLRLPAVIFATFFVTTFFTVIEGRIDGSKTSNNQRVDMIMSGIEMIQISPLYGSGHKAYQSLGPQFGVTESDAHNVFVGIGLEYGLLALSLFLVNYFLLPLYIFMKLHPKERESALFFCVLIFIGALWGMTTGLVFSDKIYILLLASFISLYAANRVKLN